MTIYWLQALGTLWFVTGLYLDGWAHENLPSTLETFFTPWHGILYSGLLLSLAVLVSYRLSAKKRGDTDLLAYLRLPIAGGIIFLIGGFLDMLWHTVLGIETNIEALYSPPHLILAFGGFILAGAVSRKWFDNEKNGTAKDWLPPIISLASAMLIVMFFVSYALPISHPRFEMGWDKVEETFGVAGVIIQSIIIAGAALIPLSKKRLPTGAAFLLITSLSYLTITHETYRFIPGILFAGVIAEIFSGWLRSKKENVSSLRIFSFMIPAMIQAAMTITSFVTKGVAWSFNLSLGSVILAGFAGLLVSVAVFPPKKIG